jgi:hypothetical protein
MRSAIDDIGTVESWGYSRAEALELVTRRAVFEARRLADDARTTPDRDVLERHLMYLDELRALWLATQPSHAGTSASASLVDNYDRRREKRGPEVSAASADAASAARRM